MFSCFHGVTYQSICLQQLGSDYVSLTGPIYVISQPTLAFETVGTPVNEGPAALCTGGKTYISCSASYCWTPSYCLGLLAWDGATDPTSASAWHKHNGFFQSPDGGQTWITQAAMTAGSFGRGAQTYFRHK